jgi:predicted PilT family ATPase
VLFKNDVLQRIATSDITLAFRRWRKPTVRSGGELRTSVGVLAIRSVDEITPASLTENEARRAGFASLEELRKDLQAQREGKLYRIEFRLAGEDPRINLRENARISKDEFATLREKLKKLDAFKMTGPWTLKVLSMIGKLPGVKAAELAAKLAFEKERLKIDIRKLKELGLTESLLPGYRLSPRGRAFLELLQKET